MSEELNEILGKYFLKRAKEIVLRACNAGVVYPANEFERVICKALQDEGIFSHKKYELTEKLDSKRMEKT